MGGFFWPEQIHIALSENPNSMRVTWVTYHEFAEASVWYRPLGHCAQSPDYTEVLATTTQFIAGEGWMRTQYYYVAEMTGLIDLCEYEYYVGTNMFASESYTFYTRVPSEAGETLTRAIIFGDLGATNCTDTNEMLKGEFNQTDLILHIGDMAYDLHANDAKVGDVYFNLIQDYAARIPYMTIPGNHENYMNFTQYKARVNMPVNKHNQGTSLYYSFDYGTVHYIMFNTETYYYSDDDDWVKGGQLNWLEEDLYRANLNRDNVPWIVMMGHKPFYCSVDWNLTNPIDDLVDFAVNWKLRDQEIEEMFGGIGGDANYNCYAQSWLIRGFLETFLYERGVDLYISGHVHNYERMAAIYENNTIASDYDDDHKHVNPNAPVYILTGFPGNNHVPARISSTPQPWSRFASQDYGYGKLYAYNKTHIYYEQIETVNQTVIDWVWIEKTRPRYDANIYN